MGENKYYSPETKKKEWITLATVVSCVAVVLLHTNGCFWTFSTERYWVTANIIECVFYFAVPCFFMITVATLIDYRKRYTTKVFLEKRAKKTVIPFIAWSLIGIGYKYLLGDISLSDITFSYVWNGIMNTSIVNIYWYFPLLFGLYLSIPIFAAVKEEYRKEVFSYAVITCFVLGGVIPLLCNTVFSGYSWNIRINAAEGYLLYVLAGYLISQYHVSEKFRRIAYLMAIIGLLVHIVGTYYLSIQAGEIVKTFKGYNNAPCIMYSVGLMIWMKYNGPSLLNSRVLRKIVQLLSPYTLNIYLMQYYIYFSAIRLFDINTTSILYRLGMPFIVIPVACITTYILRKIPVVKAIVA